MGKYVLMNVPVPTTTVSVYRWFSIHCLSGYHDYGYSDKCRCWCHDNIRDYTNSSVTSY